VYFEHLFTGVNGVANGGARTSAASERDAELIAGSVTCCDIIGLFLCSRGRICQLSSFRLQPFAFSVWTALLITQGSTFSLPNFTTSRSVSFHHATVAL
jgi:hypothetical protein